MAIKIDGLSLQQVLSQIDELIWATQVDYEACVKELASSRDQYGDDMVVYQKAMSDSYASFVGREKTVTTAKKLAEGDCSGFYGAMVKSEQRKKKFQAYVEALKERLQTLKMLARIKHGDIN